MRSRAIKLGVAFGVLVSAVLAAELYLRVASPVRFMAPAKQPDLPSGGWAGLLHVATHRERPTYELTPNYDAEVRNIRVRTNSIGLRGDELLPRETPGLVRIAVIGDSMTFGIGVQQGEDFPAQLQRELRARGGERRFEVLNFGVCGYSSLDELAVLRDKALALEPDVVVLAYCLNDPDTLPLQPLPAYFAPVEWWQHSQVLRWFANRAHGRRVRQYGGGNYWRCVHNPEGPFWRETAAALDQARDLCAARNVPVLLAILPLLNDCKSWSAYSYGDLHTFVAEQATSRGFELLDVSTSLRDREPSTLTIAPDDPHFNAQGNQLVAEALASALLANPKLGVH